MNTDKAVGGGLNPRASNPVSRAARPWIERAGVGFLCALVLAFLVWTARSNGDPWWFGLEQRDYYNLLIDGYLDGQLHMKVEVPAALLRLENPYDPALRPPDLGLHDASFYQGRYYVYFGAAPMVVLMLPFRLLTGIDLPLPVAVIVFTYGAFLASVALLLGLRRRHFPETPAWTAFVCVLVLGFAALGPVLVRRPHMWELPIGAGYCFAMVALLAIWRALETPDETNRAWRFAAAGLALGLAIASRPTYLIASPFMAVPLLYWWREERKLPWRVAWSAAMPLAAIGGLMAWHNYARFGDPLQFGQAYQFSLDYESKMAHFRATHAPFNGWRYFFSAAQWSADYPFIAPAELPPKPPGFGGHDDVYGVLRNLPIAWLALAAPLALWRREDDERKRLGVWLLTAGALFSGMAGTLVLFFGSLARYQLDFTPTLMLLACVGVLAVERWRALGSSRAVTCVVRSGWVLAAVFSVMFGALFSIQLNRFMRHRSPANDSRVAAALNRIPEALGWRAALPASGVPQPVPRSERLVRLRLQFPVGKTGVREPLVTTGRRGEGDVLWVEYGDGAVRFGLDHWGAPEAVSESVTVDFARTVELEVGMPALLAGEESGRHSVARGRLFVRVNGTLVWARSVEFYPIDAREVVIGRNPIGATTCDPEFTGRIENVERAER